MITPEQKEAFEKDLKEVYEKHGLALTSQMMIAPLADNKEQDVPSNQ